MHQPKEDEWFEKDITKINAGSIPDVSVWTGGFPCQDCSVAGTRKGLLGDRSGLFFELVRLLKERPADCRPRWLILENVKGILSSNNTTDFGIVLYELASLGYGIEYALCNSKNFGVPQNRERVYIVGDITGRSTGKIFHFGSENKAALKQVVGGPQGSRVYCTSGIAPTITSGSGGLGAKTGLFFVTQHNESGLMIKEHSGTIDANYSKGLAANQHRKGVLHSKLPRAILTPERIEKRQNGRRCKNEEEAMFTLTASDIHGILQNSRIRRLTPRECFRLQGVPDEYYERAASVCSEAQLYRQAGNAVTVPVVKAIGERIRKFVESE